MHFSEEIKEKYEINDFTIIFTATYRSAYNVDILRFHMHCQISFCVCYFGLLMKHPILQRMTMCEAKKECIVLITQRQQKEPTMI